MHNVATKKREKERDFVCIEGKFGLILVEGLRIEFERHYLCALTFWIGVIFGFDKLKQFIHIGRPARSLVGKICKYSILIVNIVVSVPPNHLVLYFLLKGYDPNNWSL